MRGRLSTLCFGALLLASAGMLSEGAKACSCTLPYFEDGTGQTIPRDGAVFLSVGHIYSIRDLFDETQMRFFLVDQDDEGITEATFEVLHDRGQSDLAVMVIVHPVQPLLAEHRYLAFVRIEEQDRQIPLVEVTVLDRDANDAVPTPQAIVTRTNVDPLLADSACGPNAYATLSVEPPGVVNLVSVGEPLTDIFADGIHSFGHGYRSDVLAGAWGCGWNAAVGGQEILPVRVGYLNERGDFSGWSEPKSVWLPPFGTNEPQCSHAEVTSHAPQLSTFAAFLLLFGFNIRRRRAKHTV